MLNKRDIQGKLKKSHLIILRNYKKPSLKVEKSSINKFLTKRNNHIL